MKRPKGHAAFAIGGFLGLSFFSSVVEATDAYPIAGLTPSQRPAGAPAIKEFVPPKNWEANMYHGIVEPYPASLAWVKDQGAWYTPFNRPNATPPYDIRGWYPPKGKNQ